jgi:hypothetical protein
MISCPDGPADEGDDEGEDDEPRHGVRGRPMSGPMKRTASVTTIRS